MHRLKRNILLIAPHPDDIAYSCILPTLDKDNECSVMTVFSRSRFAYGSSISYNEDIISAVRKSEELEFCRFINAKLHVLDYLDSSLTFSHDINYNDLYPYQNELADVINTCIYDNRFDQVYFPVALGWHYDHKIIRDVIMKKVIQNCKDITQFIMYEDLPYTLQFSEKEIGTKLFSLCKIHRFADLYTYMMKSSDVDSQIHAIEIYKSQYDKDTIRKILTHKIINGNIVEKYYKIYV